MGILLKFEPQLLGRSRRAAKLLLFIPAASLGVRKGLPRPTRIWSVGPLAKSSPAMGISFGTGGPTLTGPFTDSQTDSVFAATRSVVFAANRIVLASRVGMRKIEGRQTPELVYRLFSLDVKTGEGKDTREMSSLASLAVFSTSDGHVIVSGKSLLRPTPDLRDDGGIDDHSTGRKFGQGENRSPAGSTLGLEAYPGLDLLDARTLKATQLTSAPAVDTSVSHKGFVTDNVYWFHDHPEHIAFITYTDAVGQHLIYHGKCGGRPQFLSDDRILEPGRKKPLIFDTHGNLVGTLSVAGEFSYAGVSQNGKRFALQTASFSGAHSIKKERFFIYSVQTREPVTEVKPDELPQEQSWTAFSPDGSMFVVGSPHRLTLYRLP